MSLLSFYHLSLLFCQNYRHTIISSQVDPDVVKSMQEVLVASFRRGGKGRAPERKNRDNPSFFLNTNTSVIDLLM